MKDIEIISASEINRYTYCPYQWYYEKLYGNAELRRLYREHCEELGIEQTAAGNFRKGLQYHQQYGKGWGTALSRLTAVIMITLLLIGLYMAYRYAS